VQVATLQEQVKVQQAALEQAAALQHATSKDQAAVLQQVASLQQHAVALHHTALQQHALPLRKHASFVQPPEVPEPPVPAAPRPDSPMRSAVQKLQSQLRHKDEKLRQLKDAIRWACLGCLVGKLALAWGVVVCMWWWTAHQAMWRWIISCRAGSEWPSRWS
jgi:hypothetical protein